MKGEVEMPRKKKIESEFEGTTHALMILDESGSMSGLRQQGVETFNSNLAPLQEYTGDARVSLTLFGTQYGPGAIETVFDGEKAADVREMTFMDYNPSGGTPLWDAVGISVTNMKDRVAKDDRAIVFIFTDGHENASSEWTADKVKTLIETLQGQGNWTFVFDAAGIDAWSIAQAVGVHQGSTQSSPHTAAGMHVNTLTRSASTKNYLAGAQAQSVNFYDDQAEQPKAEPKAKPWVKKAKTPTT